METLIRDITNKDVNQEHQLLVVRYIVMMNITNLDITEFSTKTGQQQKYRLDNISYRSRNATSTTSGSHTIVALYEGRGNERGQMGLASLDLQYSELNICQFVDTSSYTLLKIRLSLLDPIEIVLPEGGGEKGSSAEVLADLLKNTTRSTQICAIHRKFFNDSRGIDLIQQMGNSESSNIDASVLSKYYCMAAAAALIKYVEYIQNIMFAQNSLKVTYEAIDDSCLIDVPSWTNMGLISVHTADERERNVRNTLFDILNNCVTSGGTRTLRSCVLQPCVDPDIINLRLDVVEELVHNQAMLERLRSAMSNLHDLQQLITLCVHVNFTSNLNREESIRSIRNKITKCVELKKLLSALNSLREILCQARCPFLVKSRGRLDDARLGEVAEQVDLKLSSNIPSVRKRKASTGEKDTVLYAVAPGQHVLLDLARRAYEELRSNIFELQNEEHLGVADAELAFNYSRGYHFSIASTDPLSVTLPTHCIQIVRNRSSVSFTTRDLIKYNDRLMQSENEILLKSNMVLDSLINAMRQNLPAFYNCVELISLLDFFSALAVYSSKTPTVRPIFGNQLIIRQGRHPILDHKHEAIANDTYAVPEARFSVIAGPNMVPLIKYSAGKSTYMQQVCLLQILAQCGCRVPAEFGCFIPMTRIFSRVGHNDALTRGMSGFALEMSEMSVILQNANDRSLIIIDELARGTSTEEGIGMSYALCEELIASKAFVFFATHFLDISFLELNHPVVRNFHISFNIACNENIDDQNADVKILKTSHILYKGRYKGPLYGLELAELTTLPESVTKRARELAEYLRARMTRPQQNDTSDASSSSGSCVKTQYTLNGLPNAISEEAMESIRRKKLACLAHRLLDLASVEQSMGTAGLTTHLQQLQLAEASDELF